VAEFLYPDQSNQIIGAAIEVHKELGPGYVEKIYHAALEHEFFLRSIPYETEKCIKVPYKGVILADYLLDLVVDNLIVVELKVVEEFVPKHQSQVLSYLKASRLRLGILLNFGAGRIQIKRVIL
jgi:GxxExxY protein